MRLKRSLAGIALVAAAYSATALIGNDKVNVPLTIACAWLMAIAIVLAAQQLRISRRAHFAVWFALLFLNFTSVAIEGTLFAPGLAPPAGLAQNLLRLAAGSAVIALFLAVLFHDQSRVNADRMARRSLFGWLWRIVAVAAVYVVLYLLLGGLNYTFVTHPYYEAHVGSVTVPPAGTIFAFEPFRGMFIAFSVLPLTLALRSAMNRPASIALVAGLMLFLIGGVVPLLPLNSLPLYLRVASLWEIFGQNFLTGATGAYVFAGTWRSRRAVGQRAAAIEGPTFGSEVIQS